VFDVVAVDVAPDDVSRRVDVIECCALVPEWTGRAVSAVWIIDRRERPIAQQEAVPDKFGVIEIEFGLSGSAADRRGAGSRCACGNMIAIWATCWNYRRKLRVKIPGLAR
jgi:hypothetical protein